jgi:hypothetical protein
MARHYLHPSPIGRQVLNNIVYEGVRKQRERGGILAAKEMTAV